MCRAAEIARKTSPNLPPYVAGFASRRLNSAISRAPETTTTTKKGHSGTTSSLKIRSPRSSASAVTRSAYQVRTAEISKPQNIGQESKQPAGSAGQGSQQQVNPYVGIFSQDPGCRQKGCREQHIFGDFQKPGKIADTKISDGNVNGDQNRQTGERNPSRKPQHADECGMRLRDNLHRVENSREVGGPRVRSTCWRFYLLKSSFSFGPVSGLALMNSAQPVS